MMGRRDREQGHLFYCFNLEEVVPEDHQVRNYSRRVGWSRAGCLGRG